MTSEPTLSLPEDLRARLLKQPEMVLDDPELMGALVAANDRARGANVIDLRGEAMRRLEGRLDRLEDTHRSVIAAAYENMAGTNLIHRAILQLVSPHSFNEFLAALDGEVPQILRLHSLRLVLESHAPEAPDVAGRVGGALVAVPAGQIASVVKAEGTKPVLDVILHHPKPALALYHGEKAAGVASEAMMPLDFGQGRLPGLLVFGSSDPAQFRPGQGTDLLNFFARVFERLMQRWLS